MLGPSHTSLQEFMKGTPASLPEDSVTGSATSPPPSVTGRGCLYVFHMAVNVKWLLQATAHVKYKRRRLRGGPRPRGCCALAALGMGRRPQEWVRDVKKALLRPLGLQSVQILSISAWRMLSPCSPPPSGSPDVSSLPPSLLASCAVRLDSFPGG